MSVFTDEFLFMNLYYGLNFPAYLVALSWITDTVNVCMISLIQLEFCVYLTRCWEGLFYSFFFQRGYPVVTVSFIEMTFISPMVL